MRTRRGRANRLSLFVAGMGLGLIFDRQWWVWVLIVLFVVVAGENDWEDRRR